MANRMSMYSVSSSAALGPRSANQQAAQVSTTTLLNALHSCYASGQPYSLDTTTSLAVNTWLSAASPDPNGDVGGTVDADLVRRAWEHARRRAEDACIILWCVCFPSSF